MDSILHLLGLARKAGRIEVGEEPVGAAARAKQARLILVAADAADNSLRRARHFAQLGNTVCLHTPYLKGALGSAVGRSACAMLALTDAGLAAAVAKRLADEDPGRYGEAALALDQKAAKMLQRQRERRQHEKNIQQGKKKPWASPPKAARPPKRPGRTPGGKTEAPPAPAHPPKAGRSVPRGRITIKRKPSDA